MPVSIVDSSLPISAGSIRADASSGCMRSSQALPPRLLRSRSSMRSTHRSATPHRQHCSTGSPSDPSSKRSFPRCGVFRPLGDCCIAQGASQATVRERDRFLSSLLFALAHTSTMGIPWLVLFGMGMLYALLRWRSNSTAAAALMHATYNAVISLAMLHA
jgi:hypothetical protein